METQRLPLSQISTNQNQADMRDLGFGSVVARESGQRLLNRDGGFNVMRSGLGYLASLSPYHALLTMSWGRFFGLTAFFYFGANLIFAAAYLLCGPGALLVPESAGIENHFLRAFFFSVHTLATIGYGTISPVGLAAKVLFARFEEVDGRPLRRFYPLKLERDRVVFFPLSWTIVHPIAETSPFYG